MAMETIVKYQLYVSPGNDEVVTICILTTQVYMLQYLTPSVLMTLLKVQQGTMIEIAGGYPMPQASENIRIY